MSNPIPRISPPDASQDEAADLPPDPSPAEWKAGDQQLREQLHWLRSQVEQRLQVLLGSVEQDLIDPLQSTAHEAAAIHAALVKTSHFDNPVEEVPPRLRWTRVRDYRRDTMARVIAPLRKQLAKLDLGAVLHERWHTFWSDLASLPSHVPASITRPEPEALYAPSSGDDVLITLRKRLVWMRRWFQRSAPSTTQNASYAQDVPLRALAAYHLRVRLPRRLDPHEHAACQHLAQAIAAFERAVTTWTHRLLDAEQQLDRAAHHVPEDADLSLPEVADTSERVSPSTAAPSPLAPSDIWAAVSAEAKTLDQQLRTLSALGFADRPAQVKSEVQGAWSDLNTDIDQAGSFLLARKDRTIPETDPQAPRSSEAAAHWTAWYRQATDRLAFCETLAALRDATYARQDALLRALIDAGLEPLATVHTGVVRALRALHEDAAARFDDASSEALAAQLRTLRDRSVELVEAKLLEPLQEAHIPRRLHETLGTHLDQFERLIDEEPASFQLHGLAPPSAEVITPDTDAREINVQSIAQDHFDTFFADALRDAVQSFGQRIQTILREDGKVPNLLCSNLDPARETLAPASSDDTEAAASARELTLNGLTRSADLIDAQTERARTAVPSLASAVYWAFTTAWTDLHDRVRAESRLREHLLELRSIMGRKPRDVSERTEDRFRVSRNRRQQKPWKRRRDGKPVSEDPSAEEDESLHEAAFLETLEALASTEQALATLPLMYRRLFAFRPVTDPALLAGRRDDLERIRRHVNQRQHDLTAPLVITGPPGCGLTSFLSVVQKRCLRDAEVRWITLDDRLRNTSAFAKRIAHALDLSLSESDGEAITLDQVREHLLAQPRPETPRVCIVEHLEHLLLRTIHGAAVADRVLTFMSRTGTHVLWLATISEPGWDVLNRTASTASTLALRHRLAPIDRPTLETLLRTRHRRSGLPVAFDPPAEPSPPLRRRLRSASTEERTQAVLRAAYFDRLYAHCGSNVMLALFYWLRSVRIDEETLTIRVRPVQPLNFDFLERFSMQQNFVLRALLDHATLTVEEYSEIASVSPNTSLALFTSLGNTLLLQPADAEPTGTAPTSVEPDRRYRIRPLVLHPVLRHLRALNLLD